MPVLTRESGARYTRKLVAVDGPSVSGGPLPGGQVMVTRTKAAVVLSVALGLLTIASGIYFAVLRPPMLPEDVRRTGLSPDLLPAAFSEWLSIVFRTWGGFMVGFGVLLASNGMFLFKGNRLWLRAGLAAASVFAFGSFLVSNVEIRSDFLWYVALLFSVAVTLAIALLRPER